MTKQRVSMVNKPTQIKLNYKIIELIKKKKKMNREKMG